MRHSVSNSVNKITEMDCSNDTQIFYMLIIVIISTS